MKIRADEVSEILKNQIKNYNERVSVSDTGTILSVGDGIARIYGLTNVYLFFSSSMLFHFMKQRI